jgi:hypothetical protein
MLSYFSTGERMRTIWKIQNKTNYTQIANTTLHDTELSWKATGMLCYFLSLPDEWQINFIDLENRKLDGQSALRSGMNELISAGYVRRVSLRNHDGTFAQHCIQVRGSLEIEWEEQDYFDSDPLSDNHIVDNQTPLDEYPDIENLHIDNRALVINNNNNTNKETINKYTGKINSENHIQTTLTPSADQWDSSSDTRTKMAKRIAVEFYTACSEAKVKKPAVKHKSLIGLIDDLLERGYTEEEIQDLFSEHYNSGGAWTLNSIAITRQKKLNSPEYLEMQRMAEYTPEEQAEAADLKARGGVFGIMLREGTVNGF